MTDYSLAEAQHKLPELIDRALKGEGIVITREGAPVAELRPIAAAPRVITQADIDWIVAHQIQPLRPLDEDAGTLLSRMRDEDGH